MNLSTRCLYKCAGFILLMVGSAVRAKCDEASDKFGIIDLINKESVVGAQLFDVTFSKEMIIRDLTNNQIKQRILCEGKGSILGPGAKLFKIDWTENNTDIIKGTKSTFYNEASYNGDTCIVSISDAGAGGKFYEIFDDTKTINRNLGTLLGRDALPGSLVIRDYSLADVFKFFQDPRWTTSEEKTNNGSKVITLLKAETFNTEKQGAFKSNEIIALSRTAGGQIDGYNFSSSLDGKNLSQMRKSSMKISDFQTVESNGNSVKLPCKLAWNSSVEGNVANEITLNINYTPRARNPEFTQSNFFQLDIAEGKMVNDRRFGVSYVAGKPKEALIDNLKKSIQNK